MNSREAKATIHQKLKKNLDGNSPIFNLSVGANFYSTKNAFDDNFNRMEMELPPLNPDHDQAVPYNSTNDGFFQ
jgi:hypothetical protein